MTNKTTRKKPDFSGVSSKFVTLDVPALKFGGRRNGSPYDDRLRELEKRTEEWRAGVGKTFSDRQSAPQPGLLYESTRAKASLAARAKKLGYRIAFAEHAGALYVRFDGRIDDDVRAKRANAILDVLKKGPRTAIQVSNALRESGDESIDAKIAEGHLLQLAKQGVVVRQEGSSFAINPKGMPK